MKLTVIIPTYGRKALLAQTLRHLALQSRLPDQVIVSVPDESHVQVPPGLPFEVELALGISGLSAQRNRAMEQALDTSDVITFFDDDFLPGTHYLARVEDGFSLYPDWALATGCVVVDGISGPGLTFDEGCAALRKAETSQHGTREDDLLADHFDCLGGYGCNMSVRSQLIGTLRFDERLPLYGWQEDTDFSRQLSARGRIVRVNGFVGVHLGAKAGRVSGIRFGYSQIANLVYLIAKGTVPWGFGSQLMARNITANIIRCLWPEPHIDRFGRLKGNLLAARHVLMGRIEPEFILKL